MFKDLVKKREYQRKWYLLNKDKKDAQNKLWNKNHKDYLKKYHKEFRIKNWDKIKAVTTKYAIEHKEQIALRKKEYYHKNIEKCRKMKRACWDRHREEYTLTHKNAYKSRMESWANHIPKETNCEICDRKIYFHNHNKKLSIHFDHHSDNVAIKVCPTSWLGKNKWSKENQAIWDSCNFGKLCLVCNWKLKTKDRSKLLIYLLKYKNV